MADDTSRAGASYATQQVLEFVNRVHAAHDPALEQAFRAPEKNAMPAIQVGPSEGRTLGILLRMINARKAVELGTLAGYSAIHMGRALPEDGHLYSVEYEPLHARVARDNIEAAGLSKKITVLEGAGLTVLPTIEKHGPFDAVFIDADKVNYTHYARWARQHLRKGGLLIADNAYFFGNLMEDSAGGEAMRTMHEEAARYFDSVCLPTPDGMVVGLLR
jgi:caffeoyl-CoA O-methyltransferase